jgi:hypothetical protein
VLRRSFVFVPALVVVGFACSERYDADTPSLPDAGVDASDVPCADVEAGPSTFCGTKPNAAWCEDFDSILDVSSLVPIAKGEIPEPVLSTGTFVSPPRALQFNVPAGKQPGQSSTIGHGVLTDKEVRLDLDWKWQQWESTENQTLQSITLRKGNGQAAFGRACGAPDGGVITCAWYIAVSADLGDAGPPLFFFIPPPAALGKWSHVALQVRFGTNYGHVRYEEDGMVLVDAQTPTEGAPSVDPVSTGIGFAMHQGITSRLEVSFDNIVLELR